MILPDKSGELHMILPDKSGELDMILPDKSGEQHMIVRLRPSVSEINMGNFLWTSFSVIYTIFFSGILICFMLLNSDQVQKLWRYQSDK